MQTIGLLGGMSWESTGLYYRLINQGVKERLGGLHSAKIALVSVDFAPIEALMGAGQWEQVGSVLAEAAQQVEAAGADFLLICTNTMHKLVPAIESAVRIPILHLADATARRIKADNLKTVGLLGTRVTMEQAFYKDRLVEKHDLNVIVPSASDREVVHRVIFDELCRGIVTDESRAAYLAIINKMHRQGAEAIIQGCTEIVMLVQQNHTDIPLYDTTAIHAGAAVALALK